MTENKFFAYALIGFIEAHGWQRYAFGHGDEPHCLKGALHELYGGVQAANESELYFTLRNFIEKRTKAHNFTGYNDTVAESKEDVIQLLKGYILSLGV